MATRNAFRFDVILSNFQKNELKLAKQVAMIQKNYYLDSFKKQGWNNKPWKQVKRRIIGTPEYTYPLKRGKSRRVKPILTMTGTLRRAVNASLYEVTTKKTVFKVSLPYAAVHNNGDPGRMPKRQYMGFTPALLKMIQAAIKENATKNFKVS